MRALPVCRFFLPVAFALTACAASPAMQAARRGDLVKLKAEIASARARGALDNDRIADLAEEVGDREIRAAHAADAIARLEDARACTHPLSNAIEWRARSPDDVGATAALVLLDAHSSAARSIDRADLVRRFTSSTSPLWRAVAARATSEGPGTARTKFLVDPDERVRLAALRAALESPSADGSEALLEAARVDPNPLARSLAVRAAGAIGHATVVLFLHDLYATADEDLRQSIVQAWASPASAEDGGVRELTWVAETDLGAPGIGAAAAIVRLRTSGSLHVDDATAASGMRLLARGIREGIARNRLLAIAEAPLATSPKGPDVSPIRDALARASQGSDESVRAAALARLAELPEQKTSALASLRTAASHGSRAAQLALARAKDKGAIDDLARQMAAADGQTRLTSFRALVDAGALDRAADLLADGDAHIRMSASCALLVASRRKSGL